MPFYVEHTLLWDPCFSGPRLIDCIRWICTWTSIKVRRVLYVETHSKWSPHFRVRVLQTRFILVFVYLFVLKLNGLKFYMVLIPIMTIIHLLIYIINYIMNVFHCSENRRKVPQSPWITKGLVKSIQNKNKLYKEYIYKILMNKRILNLKRIEIN